MLDRFFIGRKRHDAELAAANDLIRLYQNAYTDELNRRLDADTLAARHARRELDACERNHRLAHENDRLRSLLSEAHVRNPRTGRLMPRGQFQKEVLQ